MSLDFLKPPREVVMEKISRDLDALKSPVNLKRLKTAPVQRVEREIARMERKMSELREGNTQYALTPSFNRISLALKGLSMLHEQKIEQMGSEKLVPGAVYYRDVRRIADVIEGERCVYSESRDPQWVPFREKLAVLKAQEVMRCGETEDFRKIYVECADGRRDALHKIDVQHIRESSRAALKDIETYCDSRWEGPWGWEAAAPEKLMHKIEENRMDRLKQKKAHRQVVRQIETLIENDMDKFQIVQQVQDTLGKTDAMIKDVGEILSAAIEASAMGGPDADGLRTAIDGPANEVVKALSVLRQALDQQSRALQGEPVEDMAAPELDGMAPEDQEIITGQTGDIDTSSEERPLKTESIDDDLAHMYKVRDSLMRSRRPSQAKTMSGWTIQKVTDRIVKLKAQKHMQAKGEKSEA